MKKAKDITEMPPAWREMDEKRAQRIREELKLDFEWWQKEFNRHGFDIMADTCVVNNAHAGKFPDRPANREIRIYGVPAEEMPDPEATHAFFKGRPLDDH